MIYVTIRQRQKEKQITWLDIINQDDFTSDIYATTGSVGTITRKMEEPTPEMLRAINVDYMIDVLKNFNTKYNDLFEADRKSLYRHFSIPKRSGGLRPIDAPCDELKNALTSLWDILANFGILYHTAAFAYITGRSTVNEVQKHQANESNWFLKTDFSGFFPSTTLDFTMKMCSMIFPLSEICKVDEGFDALRKALSLGFLNGGLPQGTPLSPMLTNMICIPLDHELFNYFAHKRMVYTRYADDIHISCVQKFDYEKTVGYIKSVLHKWGAPWYIKPEKTKFGSRKGANWMLGCMLNAENKITVGWKAKKTFKAMTTNLIMDYKHQKAWPADDVMHYQGLLSYYQMVEKEYFENLIAHFNAKFNVNVRNIVKELISFS